jgi:hypothetical protein
MIETIVTALITGGITLLGVLISNGKRQAVMEAKIEELTREVREHNNFAKRMPVVENEITHIKDDIKLYHQQ